jgi:archaemetzincin
MKYTAFPVFLIFALLLSCKEKQSVVSQKNNNKPTVIFQPFEFTDTATLNFLKTATENFYPVSVIIDSNKQFPNHVYYKPRNRYRADSVIRWLNINNADSVRTTVGITSKDISTSKGGAYDYGVMGLGYQPGKACIVSSFRPAKKATSKQHLQERLLKLLLHEMGHNFSLPHCANEKCFMVDAEGKMKLDEENDLCKSCRMKLKI